MSLGAGVAVGAGVAIVWNMNMNIEKKRRMMLKVFFVDIVLEDDLTLVMIIDSYEFGCTCSFWVFCL